MARHFSNEPDTRIVLALRRISALCLLLTGCVGLLILLLWLVPGLRGFAPSCWSKMTANSAVGMLLCTFSLGSAFRKRAKHRRWAGMIAASLVLLLGALTLFEYAAHLSLGLDRLLPVDPASAHPGRPAPQTAFGFMMLGICMLTIRQAKNAWSMVSDLSALALFSLNLVMLGGYVYGALDLVGFGKSVLMAPQTLFGFCCIGVIVAALRAEQGDLFAVLVNLGIGSRIVRLIMPCSVFVPFVFLVTETHLRQSGLLSAPYVEAITSASASILSLCVVTWLGWRINALERDLRDQSLTDELTGVYNRRGFYFLGQQAVRESERAHNGLTLFFFDLDGLKRVNDVHGHERGSDMIKAFAGILNATFRNSDIIGRVGGDEFAVITIRDGNQWLDSVLARLTHLAHAHNTINGQIYALNFSMGYAELHPGRSESLEDIVTRADTMMYADKAAKKIAA